MRRARALAEKAERHERALGVLAAHPDLPEQMAAALREAGPAFPVESRTRI